LLSGVKVRSTRPGLAFRFAGDELFFCDAWIRLMNKLCSGRIQFQEYLQSNPFKSIKSNSCNLLLLVMCASCYVVIAPVNYKHLRESGR